MTDETIDDFENEEMRDAIHEAGHAVYGLLHGFGIRRVFISRDGPRAGAVRWSNPWDYCALGWENTEDGRAFAEQWMVCHLAGIAAEETWSGCYHEWGATGDFTRVGKILARLIALPAERSEYITRLWEMAMAFTRDPRNWRGIHALAQALVRRQNLSGEVAEQIVMTAMEENPNR